MSDYISMCIKPSLSVFEDGKLVVWRSWTYLVEFGSFRSDRRPVILLHGLLGSGVNLRTVAVHDRVRMNQRRTKSEEHGDERCAVASRS